MKHLSGLVLAVVFPVLALAQPVKPGAIIADFTVNDVKGNPVSFASLKGAITVTTFIATGCPVSNDYNERMKALYADYAPKGVKFVFVNSNVTEPPRAVEEHAGKNGFPFPVYKDPGNVVADKFGAEFTPDVFVLDSSGTVVYHGHIDDSRNPANIKKQTLRVALDALVAGKPVPVAETKAFGCTIKRVKKP